MDPDPSCPVSLGLSGSRLVSLLSSAESFLDRKMGVNTFSHESHVRFRFVQLHDNSFVVGIFFLSGRE